MNEKDMDLVKELLEPNEVKSFEISQEIAHGAANAAMDLYEKLGVDTVLAFIPAVIIARIAGSIKQAEGAEAAAEYISRVLAIATTGTSLFSEIEEP